MPWCPGYSGALVPWVPWCHGSLAQVQEGWGEVSSARLPRAVRYTAAAALSGRVYLAGGYDDGYVRRAELLELTTAGWQARRDMGTARSSHRLVSAGGFLYAVGGHGSSRCLSSVRATRGSKSHRSRSPTRRTTSLFCSPIKFESIIFYRYVCLIQNHYKNPVIFPCLFIV